MKDDAAFLLEALIQMDEATTYLDEHTNGFEGIDAFKRAVRAFHVQEGRWPKFPPQYMESQARQIERAEDREQTGGVA